MVKAGESLNMIKFRDAAVQEKWQFFYLFLLTITKN